MSHQMPELDLLMFALPKLPPLTPYPIATLAAEIGVSEALTRRGLQMLARKEHPEPAGFIEAVSISLTDTHVTLERADHFRRPTQLTTPEVHALALGIAIMRAELPASEAGLAYRVREKLRTIALNAEAVEEPTIAAQFADGGMTSAGIRRLLGYCAARSLLAHIGYQRPQDAQPNPRVVGPLGLANISGIWYLFARDGAEGMVKQFRIDRIVGVARTEESFDPPEGFDLAEYLGDGRPFVGQASEEGRIRYTGIAARLVAEDDGLELDPDGSVTVTYPLADEDWAIRQALRYGMESELLSPPALRTRIAQRLRALEQSAASGR